MVGGPTIRIARQLWIRFAYAAVPARVIESRVIAFYDEGMRLRWRPQVRYRYEIGGRVLDGTQFRVGGADSRHREDIVATLASYQPGAHVTAYVCPLAPQHAWLEPRLEAWPYVLLVLAVAFLWAFFRWLARQGQKERERSRAEA